MQNPENFSAIDSTDLDHVIGGAGEGGVMKVVRAGLLGASLLMGGGKPQMPPRIEPIRIEQPVNVQTTGGK